MCLCSRQRALATADRIGLPLPNAPALALPRTRKKIEPRVVRAVGKREAQSLPVCQGEASRRMIPLAHLVGILDPSDPALAVRSTSHRNARQKGKQPARPHALLLV